MYMLTSFFISLCIVSGTALCCLPRLTLPMVMVGKFLLDVVRHSKSW